MQIIIFGNIHSTKPLSEIIKLINSLKDNGITVAIEKEYFEHLEQNSESELNALKFDTNNSSFDADFAISIGGDGTFLRSSKFIGEKNIPILGINTGRLGFLVDFTMEDTETIVQILTDKQYKIEERALIEVLCNGEKISKHPYALNEVAILKQDLSSIIKIDSTINGNYLNTYEADGLIIATPTGSTAYNLSVNGPILFPSCNNLIISPVASHSLNIRPLVIPDDWVIDLKIKSRSHCYLVSIDGRSKLLEDTKELQVRKAKHKLKVIKPLDNSFFGTLKNKLLWGTNPRG